MWQAVRWQEMVKQRDGYKCVDCGRTDHLQVHHIKPVHIYPECKNDIDNGITLCPRCHQHYHGGHFAGDKMLPVHGIDPDPEDRQKEHRRVLDEQALERRRLHFVWGSNNETGPLLVEAAEAAGVSPQRYIAEAVSMRLRDEGFDHDWNIFLKPWERENNT